MNGFSLKNLSRRGKAILIGAGFGVVVIILVAILVAVYQDYLHQMKIVNVENYPTSLPADMRENLQVQLRRLLTTHFEAPEDAMIAGAIREGTYRENTAGEITTATFVVDIDAYKQTYAVVMNWSETVELSDAILISCPDTSVMRYPDVTCIAMYNNSQDVKNIEENPLYDKLPIIVDEFDFASRASVHYEIRGYFNTENKLVIVINDYSGGNYENGLARIRALGYEPGNYKIEYYNRAGEL